MYVRVFTGIVTEQDLHAVSQCLFMDGLLKPEHCGSRNGRELTAWSSQHALMAPRQEWGPETGPGGSGAKSGRFQRAQDVASASKQLLAVAGRLRVSAVRAQSSSSLVYAVNRIRRRARSWEGDVRGGKQPRKLLSCQLFERRPVHKSCGNNTPVFNPGSLH